MKRLFVSVLAVFAPLLAPAAPPDDKSGGWPQWRGPLGTGVAPRGNPPTEWGDGKNIRWKVELPGRGHATPIIWGDRIYIQTAIRTERTARADGNAPGEVGADVRVDASEPAPQDPPPGDRPGGGRRRRGPAPKPTNLHEFAVVAFDRKTGDKVWQTVVREELPHEAGHETASLASGSPVTDGERIYAYFGSRGLFCLGVDGKVQWEKDLGDMQTRNEFGEGSSPALYGDTVVVQWDHEGEDFVVALDAKTGAERWRQARDEPTSWATPVIVASGDGAQVITSATNSIRSYDLKSGEVLWECGGMTQNVIPTPLFDDGVAFIASGFRGAALLAIRVASARGNITDSPAVIWRYAKDTPYVPSPLLYGNRLYFLENNRGVLTCLNARDGETLFGPERIEDVRMVYASLAGAGDRVYLVARDGTTVVFRNADKFEVLATNKLDDEFDASPAIVDDELYLRGAKYLYCIAKD